MRLINNNEKADGNHLPRRVRGEMIHRWWLSVSCSRDENNTEKLWKIVWLESRVDSRASKNNELRIKLRNFGSWNRNSNGLFNARVGDDVYHGGFVLDATHRNRQASSDNRQNRRETTHRNESWRSAIKLKRDKSSATRATGVNHGNFS